MAAYHFVVVAKHHHAAATTDESGDDDALLSPCLIFVPVSTVNVDTMAHGRTEESSISWVGLTKPRLHRWRHPVWNLGVCGLSAWAQGLATCLDLDGHSVDALSIRRIADLAALGYWFGAVRLGLCPVGLNSLSGVVVTARTLKSWESVHRLTRKMRLSRAIQAQQAIFNQPATT